MKIVVVAFDGKKKEDYLKSSMVILRILWEA